MTSWWIFIIENIFLALITGLATSILFILILQRYFTPRIEISPQIARGKSTLNDKTIYRIKILNKGRRAVVDNKAQLHILKRFAMGERYIWKTEFLELKRPDPLAIESASHEKEPTPNAFRFLTYAELEKKWRRDHIQIIRFRIFTRDSWSGIGRLFVMDYSSRKGTIVEGEFAPGESFEIRPQKDDVCAESK